MAIQIPFVECCWLSQASIVAHALLLVLSGSEFHTGAHLLEPCAWTRIEWERTVSFSISTLRLPECQVDDGKYMLRNRKGDMTPSSQGYLKKAWVFRSWF